MSELEPLVATHVLEFGYTRSLGPTLGAFFKGLAERKIVGVLLRETDGGQLDARRVDALVLAEQSALHDQRAQLVVSP